MEKGKILVNMDIDFPMFLIRNELSFVQTKVLWALINQTPIYPDENGKYVINYLTFSKIAKLIGRKPWRGKNGDEFPKYSTGEIGTALRRLHGLKLIRLEAVWGFDDRQNPNEHMFKFHMLCVEKSPGGMTTLRKPNYES